MKTLLKGKHLLSTNDWTNEEIETLMLTTEKLKLEYTLGIQHDDILRAKSLFMLFFEESTRTRNAFECGMTQLGGHGNFLTPKATQVDHGETPKDTIEVLGRMGHAIGIRNCSTKGHDWIKAVAKHSSLPVYNMQSDIWHPTQALADLFTIREKFGRVF